MVVTVVGALALGACTSQVAPSSSVASSSTGASGSEASSSAVSSSTSSSAAEAPKSVTIELDYSAGTGYEWSYEASPEGVVELIDQETENRAAGDVAGGSLRDRFTFSAVHPGEVVLTFDLVRSWEADEPPAETQVYAFTVTDDLQVILNPYKSDFDNEPMYDERS